MMKPDVIQTRDSDRLDLDDTSLDGNYFHDLVMEFPGHDDFVNTFTDTEVAAAPVGGPRAPPNQVAVPVEDDMDITESSTRKKKKDGAIKGPSRRKKRPKGKPRRPLCGYNIFFQQHSKEIQANTPFKDLGRIMGERWKSLTEDEKAVYEKEAEKDVVRFRKEMDIYEKKRKERLCPPLESASKDDAKYCSNPQEQQHGMSPAPLPTLQAPPGWLAAPAGSVFGGAVPPAAPPQTCPPNFMSINHGAPWLPSPPGLHVPGQFVGPAPNHMSLPQGAEISLPDATSGAVRKYRVVYGCYRMTQQEANEYMARFAALTGTNNAPQQPSAAPSGPPPTTFSQGPPPPSSPHAARPIFLNPTNTMPPPPSPHPSPRSHH